MTLQLRNLLLLLCLARPLHALEQLTEKSARDFIHSFISAYELSPEGRYTHEYHPFLLQWTSQSLDQLEEYLVSRELSLDGRMIIMGYEEHAVGQYYTDFNKPRINDEAMRKNNAGWSMRLHNRFGFMTGFLFKQLNGLVAKHPDRLDTTFQHIDSDMVHIFRPSAGILQEHAFGDALPVMSHYEERVLERLTKKDPACVLAALESFWQFLYKKAFRVGSKEIAGTQDVLFSIEYIKHLQRSPLPVQRFFTGPDITYPIEITQKQSAGATLHAQHFVKQFIPNLKPINDEATVYIFCSFVDGVGKSTMLGNVKNWMRHEGDINAYDHVDNSSSQLAEVFKFKDNVFIADLPAQVSHFTYKPDGLVYVDAATEMPAAETKNLLAYVKEHEVTLHAEYRERLQQVQGLIEREGIFAPALHDKNNPHDAFIRNVVMLKKQERNLWIPFTYEGQPYIVKNTQPREVRCLIPLGRVKSEGLKNIEAEQMLFFEGVRFPARYDFFMNDLATRLKEQGVKHVVFVDFLSMYPRSSRENIRINYLLQQIALLESSFDPRWCLYHDFISGGELLDALLHRKSRNLLTTSLVHEACVRLALFKLLFTVSSESIDGLSLEKVTRLLKEAQGEMESVHPYITQCAERKVAGEIGQLEKAYGLSKAFVNIQLLSFKQLAALSCQLEEVFTRGVDSPLHNAWWEPVGEPFFTQQVMDGIRIPTRGAKPVMTGKGAVVRLWYLFHEECRNPQLLAPCVRALRANWYAQILNLLYASGYSGDDKLSLARDLVKGVPLQVQPCGLNLYSVVQPWCEPATDVEKGKKTPSYEFDPYFSLRTPESFTRVAPFYYRIDWECRETNRGVMGFDCRLEAEEGADRYAGVTAVSSVIQKYHNNNNAKNVLPTSELWQRVQEDNWWSYDQQTLHREALHNGPFDRWLNAWLQSPDDRRPYKKFVGTESRRPIAQLVVRLLATLEMVVKDPDSDSVVRYGNREDFKAALQLFQHIVLPNYANIVFTDPLFDDVDAVEPYPNWAYWDELVD